VVVVCWVLSEIDGIGCQFGWWKSLTYVMLLQALRSDLDGLGD